MGVRALATLAIVALAVSAAGAETLGDVLKGRGLAPPAGVVPGLGETVQASQVLDDGRELVVVHLGGQGDAVRLHATRFRRASGAWTAVPLDWTASDAEGAPKALAPEQCRGGLALDRVPGGLLVGAHINPSAECTIVLGTDLSVRAVLAGWPVATLADGRLVYQRNQIHFAAFHAVGLALFDPRQARVVSLYPRKPYQAIRAAHVARMRAVYTQAWCNAHNHPCDPDLFDEQITGRVVTDAGGDALAFVVAWDNTTGWSDALRWGRLEAFRELRAAVTRWSGPGAPPDDWYRGLAAGLARTRNLKGEGHVAAALAGEPALRDLVGAALASRPPAGEDDRTWLLALDRRWADGETWRLLARAVEVPAEFTEVAHVYTGLRRPGSIRYRELLRQDVEARFGPGGPRRWLDPDVLRRIFPAGAK